MSSGVLSLFPGLTLQQITPLPFAVTFDCPLIAGKYEPGAVGPIPLHTASPGVLYYMDDITIGSDVSDLDLSAALVDRLNLNVLQSKFKINKSYIPIVGMGSIPLQMWYKVIATGSKKTSDIKMQLSGSINQTPALATKATLKIFVRGIIYQITDTNWIRAQLGG